MEGADPIVAGKSGNSKKRTIVKPVPKGKFTRFYEARRATVYAFAERVRIAFFSDSWTATIMWLLIVLVCLGVLAWFFFVSPYGTPAEPIYEGF